ncbi:Glycoside hydrolase family 79 protein [Pleurostoma richardsiae]|uniref:Glycoside hydrolase family 79 protein n=1 Tax=Pleurostoma richardsiae TaxID=41990 RepID=A0AA38SEZ4_9PEZI|nr:Glycoside hydrolase family 79 protein [Pleurostoma richardsiae]
MWPPPFSLLAFGAAAAAATVKVNAPNQVPQGASDAVDPAFLGFGIESTSFPDFVNQFSQNLFNAISSRTGVPTIVRIGGTSLDHAIFDLSQQENVIWPEGDDDGLESNITFGSTWFDSLGVLNNTKYMLQFPLARDNGTNYTNAVEFVQSCIDAMGVEKLQSIEIGNEVDLFVTQGFRNSSYGPENYADEVKTYMDLLSRNITELPDGKIFQIFDKSSEVDEEAWTIDNFINETEDMIDLSDVQTIAAHYYQTYDGDDLQSTLLNHSYTVSKTNEYFLPFIKAAKANNFTFIIDEVGSSLGNNAESQPDYHLAASLGSAVWTVDWLLYVMSINVTRVNMQMGKDFAFSAWRPVNSTNGTTPQVLGGWYGHVFVADFMGPGLDVSTTLRVQELKTGNDNVTAYGGYHDGKLTRVALTNQQLWEANSTTARQTETVQLALPSATATSVTVKRLTGPSGDAQSNITWAGLDWPYSTEGTVVEAKRDDTQVLQVQNGTVNVIIEATEALLVYL